MKFAIIFLLFISVSACGNSSIIDAENENISIIGRADLKDGKATFAHAGVQIKFNFKGEKLEIGLTDITDGSKEHLNFYNIYINDSLTEVIEITPSKKWYSINYKFDNQPVEVTIFKRTEPMCAGGIFEGLRINEGAEVLKSKSKSRKIEWVGDSFTTGYGNLVSNPAPPKGNPSTGFHAKNQDNSKAWGAIASKTLDAEYMCTAYSGRGVYRNYNNSVKGTLPKIYIEISPDTTNKKWNFNLYQPDLIVVNLGQNDFGPETYSPVIMTDSLRFTNAYLELLEVINIHNPNAKILITIGGGLSDYYPLDFKRLSRSRLWLNNIKNTFNQSHPNSCNIFELKTIIAPYGEDWHPTFESHKTMANQAVVVIKKIMNW
jgi:hypothetical protein